MSRLGNCFDVNQFDDNPERAPRIEPHSVVAADSPILYPYG